MIFPTVELCTTSETDCGARPIRSPVHTSYARLSPRTNFLPPTMVDPNWALDSGSAAVQASTAAAVGGGTDEIADRTSGKIR